MKPRMTVIVITPSESLRNQYALQIDVWGYRVLLAASMDEAMAMVCAEQPDAVLCDRMADGMIRQLAAAAPERTGFVLVTERQSPASLCRAVPGFNALLRERLQAASTRHPGPKKESASSACAALSTGTHAVLTMLLCAAAILQMPGRTGTHGIALQTPVGVATVNLRGSIPAQITAQRTPHRDVVAGNLIDSGRNIFPATLAAHHELIAPHAVQVRAAVVHAHAVKVSALAVDTQNAPQPVHTTTTDRAVTTGTALPSFASFSRLPECIGVEGCTIDGLNYEIESHSDFFDVSIAVVHEAALDDLKELVFEAIDEVSYVGRNFHGFANDEVADSFAILILKPQIYCHGASVAPERAA